MHGNKFIFFFPQVMKQTGGLYPAPLKILDVSLVVIILMQTLLSRCTTLPCCCISTKPWVITVLGSLVWEGLMVELCRKNVTEVFSPVLLIEDPGRGLKLWFSVSMGWLATNQNPIVSILKENHAIPVVRFHRVPSNPTLILFWYYKVKRPLRDSVIAIEWSFSLVSQALQN